MLKLTPLNIKKVIKSLEKKKNKADSTLFQELILTAERIKAEARKRIARLSRGRKYTSKGIVRFSSRPGDAPNTQTGTLIRGIESFITNQGVGVRSRAKYSKKLEFGAGNIEARPFLEPSLLKIWGRDKSKVIDKIVKSMRKVK